MYSRQVLHILNAFALVGQRANLSDIHPNIFIALVASNTLHHQQSLSFSFVEDDSLYTALT